MEALAIVAHVQPVTRSEIEAIRGVNSDSVVSTLLDRGLIAEAGRKDVVGRPMQYKTTPFFLGVLRFALARRSARTRAGTGPAARVRPRAEVSKALMRIGLHVHVARRLREGGRAREGARLQRDASLLDQSSQLPHDRDRRQRRCETFARLRREAGIDPCAIHTPYLINLASADPKIAAGSLRSAAQRSGGCGARRHALRQHASRARTALAIAREGSRRSAARSKTALDEIEPGVHLVWKTRRAPAISPAGRSKSSARSSRSVRPSATRRLPRYGARVGLGL